MLGRTALLLVILALLGAVALKGQTEKAVQVPPVSETRAADLLAGLSKSVYTARRTIPVSENIFVEDGRVLEGSFALTRKENPTAVAANQTVKVSKVLLLEKALHIFFADDKCALLILTKDGQGTDSMTLEQLGELARKGVGALFTSKPAPPKPVT